jgi:hypothetical protein
VGPSDSRRSDGKWSITALLLLLRLLLLLLLLPLLLLRS